LTKTKIAMNTGASSPGRLPAQAAVTLQKNVVTIASKRVPAFGGTAKRNQGLGLCLPWPDLVARLNLASVKKPIMVVAGDGAKIL
jgi:hypothetical protein